MSHIFEEILHFTTITTSISNTPRGHGSIGHDHSKGSVVALDLLDIFQSSGELDCEDLSFENGNTSKKSGEQMRHRSDGNNKPRNNLFFPLPFSCMYIFWREKKNIYIYIHICARVVLNEFMWKNHLRKKIFRQTFATPTCIFSGTCWPRLARKMWYPQICCRRLIPCHTSFAQLHLNI